MWGDNVTQHGVAKVCVYMDAHMCTYCMHRASGLSIMALYDVRVDILLYHFCRGYCPLNNSGCIRTLQAMLQIIELYCLMALLDLYCIYRNFIFRIDQKQALHLVILPTDRSSLISRKCTLYLYIS